MGAKYLPTIRDQKASQRFQQQQQAQAAARARQKELAQELSRTKKEKKN